MLRYKITTVNTFDLCDAIIDIHKKNNISLTSCKLQTICFLYQIVSRTTHVIPSVDDDFILKNNFVFLVDVEHKYRKTKKEDITKLKQLYKKIPFSSYGSANKLLTHLCLYFENYSDKLLRKLVRKTPIYIKTKNENQNIVKMEKKDFIKYYPLQKWEDGYNMILDIDNKIPLFRL